MSTNDLIAPVITRLHELLKPLGYRKQGITFRRSLDGVAHFVQIQKSTSSTMSAVKFTVNLGACDVALSEWMTGSKTISLYECQWRRRIGSVIPARQDTWWLVTCRGEAESAAAECVGAIREYGLPELSKVATSEQIRRRIVAGTSGMSGTYLQRAVEYITSRYVIPSDSGDQES